MAPSTYSPAVNLDLRLDRTVGETRSTAAVQDQVLQLFDACAPGLRRYVRACGLPPEAAEDVVQEAFLALFHHLRRGGGTQNLRGWLVQVSYRLALKQRERLARRHQQEIALDGPGPELVDPAADPETAVASQQQQRRLHAVMQDRKSTRLNSSHQ